MSEQRQTGGGQRQTVVVTGAASGIGQATVGELLDRGAVVHAVDLAAVDDSVERTYRCDLGDPVAIAALAAELPATFDALICCAGVAGGRLPPVDVFAVNFLGTRALIEAMIPRLGGGSVTGSVNGSVTTVASVMGNGWPAHRAVLDSLIETPSFADGLRWAEQHADLLGSGYPLSKEALQYYTLRRAPSAIAQGVRINSVCPGPVETPMMGDFAATPAAAAAIDAMVASTIARRATPAEVAAALVFLSAPTASYLNGVNLYVDGGFTAQTTVSSK